MAETTDIARAPQYRADIDGLRALAILPVVLFHAGVRWMPGGFSGVDIFFAISGYLIGGHIYGDLLRGTFSYLGFYQRRAKRILPALFVVLAAVLLVGSWMLSPSEFRDLGKYASGTLGSVSNVLLWRGLGYFTPKAETNPLLMTWSLGVEEQFYLVIPVLMVVLTRLRLRLLLRVLGCVGLASFALAWLQVARYPVAGFYLLPSRVWEMIAGVGLAIAEKQARRLPLREEGSIANAAGWLGLGLILAPLWLLGPGTPFPGPAALPSVAGCAMLLASSGSWVNRKLLTLRVPVAIGRVSFSWYLWHWPMLALLRAIWGRTPPLVWGLGAVAEALVLAAMTYRFVEQPFRSSRRDARPLLLRYGAMSAAMLLLTLTIWRGGGMGWRYPVVAAIDATQRVVQEDPCLANTGETQPREDSNCAAVSAGPLTRRPEIAMWGDSHAAALTPAMRVVAGRQGYAVVEYAKSVCPPLLGAGPATPGDLGHPAECMAFNDAVLRKITGDPRVEVVGLEAFWESSVAGDRLRVAAADRLQPDGSETRNREIFQEALQRTVEAVQSAGKRVVIFGDVPTFATDPLWRMRTSRIPARAEANRTLAWSIASADAGGVAVDAGTDRPSDNAPREQRARDLVESAAAAIAGVTFWDLRRELCLDMSRCRYAEGSVPLYVDENHLTIDGGELALKGWTPPGAVIAQRQAARNSMAAGQPAVY